MTTAQKRLTLGLALGVGGIIVAVAFSKLIGIVLAAAGVVTLGLLAAGYASLGEVRRGERSLETGDGGS